MDVIWINDNDQYLATLPDGTKWTSDTDTTRFTDPDHENFWKPPQEDDSIP